MAATMIRIAAPPAAMPAIAAVLRAVEVLGFFKVDGSTVEMSTAENTESLRPKSSVALGLWRQPVSRATRARTGQQMSLLSTYSGDVPFAM